MFSFMLHKNGILVDLRESARWSHIVLDLFSSISMAELPTLPFNPICFHMIRVLSPNLPESTFIQSSVIEILNRTLWISSIFLFFFFFPLFCGRSDRTQGSQGRVASCWKGWMEPLLISHIGNASRRPWTSIHQEQLPISRDRPERGNPHEATSSFVAFHCPRWLYKLFQFHNDFWASIGKDPILSWCRTRPGFYIFILSADVKEGKGSKPSDPTKWVFL